MKPDDACSTRCGEGTVTRSVERHEGPGACADVDAVVVEEPIEIRIRGRSICVTMRTPGDDEDLALGFLLGEGIIHSARDVVRVEHCARNDSDNVINVLLAPEVMLDLQKFSRHVFASSSCGVCGKATLEAIHQSFAPTHSTSRIDPRTLIQLPERLRSRQQAFTETGGLHAAGLFSTSGATVAVREDVGRHNAVDKTLGYAARMLGLPLDDHVLLVSGRASFEIVQKALAGGVPIVAAVSAPSSLAIDLALESGQTLVGFLRDGRFNVYANDWRVSAPAVSDGGA